MTGNPRRYFKRSLSITAIAAAYAFATVAVAGLTMTAIDAPAMAAPHGGHGGPHGGPHGPMGGPHGGPHMGPHGGPHMGPHGGPHMGPHGPHGVVHGGPHHGHWFGGRPGWIHGHRYFWGSLWYCWYPVGYNGPGWYVCGANW